MNSIAALMNDTLQDNYDLLMELFIFLTTGVIAFSVLAFVRTRSAVKRRANGIRDDGEPGPSSRALRYSSLKAVTQLIEYTTKHYGTANDENMKVLRRRLIQAGIYDSRATAYFFIARTVLAIGIAAAIVVLLPIFYAKEGSIFWLVVIVGGIAGYVGPSVYIDKRISARKIEHRSGFPDFMDLLVVCADSGLSMEASLERVGRELGDSYPHCQPTSILPILKFVPAVRSRMGSSASPTVWHWKRRDLSQP